MFEESINQDSRRAKLIDLAQILDGCLPIAFVTVLDEPAPTHIRRPQTAVLGSTARFPTGLRPQFLGQRTHR